MRNLPVLMIFLLVIISCSKKSVPTKSPEPKPVTPKTQTETKISPPSPEIKKDTTAAVPSAPAATVASAMIVIDGYGRVLTPAGRLPDSTLKPDYAKISRAFTPQQIANLKARYKTVPPKVLYVPEQYTQKSMRGTYCIYKKKFWYWKKDDGLFYLDEVYYM